MEIEIICEEIRVSVVNAQLSNRRFVAKYPGMMYVKGKMLYPNDLFQEAWIQDGLRLKGHAFVREGQYFEFIEPLRIVGDTYFVKQERETLRGLHFEGVKNISNDLGRPVEWVKNEQERLFVGSWSVIGLPYGGRAGLVRKDDGRYVFSFKANELGSNAIDSFGNIFTADIWSTEEISEQRILEIASHILMQDALGLLSDLCCSRINQLSHIVEEIGTLRKRL